MRKRKFACLRDNMQPGSPPQSERFGPDGIRERTTRVEKRAFVESNPTSDESVFDPAT